MVAEVLPNVPETELKDWEKIYALSKYTFYDLLTDNIESK